MRAIGMTPIAGPSVVKQLTAAVQENALAQAVAQTAAAVPMVGQAPGMAILGKALFGHIEGLNRQAHEEFERQRYSRINGLDADIAVLRSVSPTYKAALQRKRDQEFSAIALAASKLLWGH